MAALRHGFPGVHDDVVNGLTDLGLIDIYPG
jgi:hypothetical protein